MAVWWRRSKTCQARGSRAEYKRHKEAGDNEEEGGCEDVKISHQPPPPSSPQSSSAAAVLADPPLHQSVAHPSLPSPAQPGKPLQIKIQSKKNKEHLKELTTYCITFCLH